MSNRIKGKVDDTKRAREGVLDISIFDQVTDLIAYGVMKTNTISQYPIDITKGDYEGCNFVAHDWVKLEPHLKTLCSRNGLDLDLNQTVEINGQALLVEYALLYYSQVSTDSRLFFAAKFIMELREYYLWANGFCDADVVETLFRYGDSKTSFVASLSQSTFVKGITRSKDGARGGEQSQYDGYRESIADPIIIQHIKDSRRPSKKESVEALTERVSIALQKAGCRYAYALSVGTVRDWKEKLEKGMVIF